jgi:hypothetical protein
MSRRRNIAAIAGRHPFRASLKPYLVEPERHASWRLNAQDVRDFLLAYCACFICVWTFFS